MVMAGEFVRPALDPANRSLVERLLRRGAKPREIVAALPPTMRARLRWWWALWARPKQIPSETKLVTLLDWGRGGGKTRAGAEWVRDRWRRGAKSIALGARTRTDGRALMVEGPAGILAVSPPNERPVFKKQERKLIWPNGAVGRLFTGEEPDEGRGYEADTLWADELASWQYWSVWDNLLLGLRGKDLDPRAMVTTTPKPHKRFRALLEDAEVEVVRANSYENAANLPADFVRAVLDPIARTRLGLQEVFAELSDETPGALWSTKLLDKHRVGRAPALQKIAGAIDPASTYGPDADETGMIFGGLGYDGHVYIFGDASGRHPPPTWARLGCDGLALYNGEYLIGEQNNGGEMVRGTILAVNPAVGYKAVHASRGKRTRAEPVATWTEMGRVHLVGFHAELEAELTGWVPDAGMDSPNRLDAFVYLVTDLLGGAMIAGHAPAPMPPATPSYLEGM